MEYIALNECCEILDSQRIPIAASQRKKGEYPYYGANGIQGYVDNFIFDDELVLLAEDGGNFGSKNKPIAYRVSGKCWINNHAHVLKPKKNINIDYLCYALMFYNVDSLINGATRKKLTQSAMKKMRIPLRTMKEQNKIVKQIGKVLEVKQQIERQLVSLDELVKSRFIELFGDPLHPVHSRALGDVAMLERGRFSPRPRNDPRYYGGDYPFIQTGDIAGCGHRLSEYRQTLNEKGIHVSKKFSAGTIVIAIVGATIGATAILEIDVYAPDSVIGISVNDELYNNVFMEALLQFWQPELVRIAPESARANINLRILQSIPIIDVELPRQLQFASFVAQVDKSKLVVQKALDETQLLFDSLMQKYFG